MYERERERERERIVSDRENMTIVGAKLCVCVCVWSGWGWHGRGASHFLLGCSCKPFFPLSFPFFFLSSPFPLLSFPSFSFLSFPFVCVFLSLPLHTFFPFCLPLLLTPSLSYFAIPPSLYASVLRGKGCHCTIVLNHWAAATSYIWRLGPLCYSLFHSWIHMHMLTHIKYTVSYCSVLYLQPVTVAVSWHSNTHTYILKQITESIRYLLMELTLGTLSLSHTLSARSLSRISQANMVGFWRL